MVTKRKYELRARAEGQAATRRRITEATVALHESVGPARATVAEIARAAGVQRLTVYNHFPDDRALFKACAAHWNAGHPLPDPTAWAAIPDSRRRTETGLGELYAFYARNRPMISNLLRDAELMPQLALVVAEALGPSMQRIVETLLHGAPQRGRRRMELRAMLAVAVEFHSWRRLVDCGLESDQAAVVMTRSVWAESG